MTLDEAKSAIEVALSAAPFENLDHILGDSWASGRMFRGYAPAYRAAALERAEYMDANSIAFGAAPPEVR